MNYQMQTSIMNRKARGWTEDPRGKFVRMEEEAMRVTDHPILGEMKDVRTVDVLL